MIDNNPIRRSAYKSLTQEALAVFAGNVASRMLAAPAYQSMLPEVQALQAKNDAYQLALIQAKDRAIQNVALKNALRQEVVDLLDQLVNLLVVANNGEPSWIVNAGMVPTQKRQRVMADIPVPVNLQVKRSDQPGELIIKFQNRSPKRILTNAVEYSTDGGMSWKNGTYGNSRGILLSGLPSRQEVLVKVRSLGRNTAKSGWTEPVTVFVV